MAKDEEKITSSVDPRSASQQEGIPLKVSEPLSHDPYVHVTLDAVDKPKQVVQPVGQPVQNRPQQRVFPYMPEKPPRVVRNFPQQQNDASGGQSLQAGGFNGLKKQFGNNVRDSRSINTLSGGLTGVPMGNQAQVGSGVAQFPNKTNKNSSDARSVDTRSGEGSSKSPDPFLRIILEDQDDNTKDGNNASNNAHAQDELNDLATHMPMIPKSLMFDKIEPSPSMLGAKPSLPQYQQYQQSQQPQQVQQAQQSQKTASMPAVVPNQPNAFGGYNAQMQGNMQMQGDMHLQGSPQMQSNMQVQNNPQMTGNMQMQGDRLNMGGGQPPVQFSALPDSHLQGNPRNLIGTPYGTNSMVGTAASSPFFTNQQSDIAANITPSVAAVPPSIDYRPFASTALGAGLNPLRPHTPPSMFDPQTGRFLDWKPQSLQMPSAFPDARDAAMEQTLPSGMPVSFDRVSNALGRSGATGSFASGSYAAQISHAPQASQTTYGSQNINRTGGFSPSRPSNSPFLSSGNRGLPHDAGTPIPRGNFAKPISDTKPKPKSEGESLFDQPPVPITEGMKSAETNHKRLRRVIIIVLIVVVLALAGIVGYLVASGTVNLNQLIPSVTIEAPSDNSSSKQDSSDGNADGASGSTESSSSASVSATDAGSVVYQYTALTSDGTAYSVEETATFSDEGYCEFTTMRMKFPDADKAKSFTDNLARDYGDSFTLDSLDGANATVTIDNSSLHLDREKYEESLRYSVEDLVILKK